MSNSTQLIRDRILFKSIVCYKDCNKKPTKSKQIRLFLTARQITVVEPVQLTNIDLFSCSRKLRWK